MEFTRFNRLRRRALAVGLDVATYAPGDGTTRYNFVRVPARLISDPQLLPTPPAYFAGGEVGRCLGIREAETWLEGFGMGRISREWLRATLTAEATAD